MSLVKLMTQGDVAKLIDDIAATATVLQDDIHTAAVNTFNHAFVHGDWTSITRLMDVLPNGQRVKALAYWYGHFSNGALSLSKDPETRGWRVNKDRFAKRAELVPDVEAATEACMETNFADLTAEKDPQTLTLERFYKSMKRTSANTSNFQGTDIPKVSPAVRNIATQIVEIIDKAAQAA